VTRIAPLPLLPRLSRAAGERLPWAGRPWKHAGALLDQLARPVEHRFGAGAVRARCGGEAETVALRTADGLELAATFLPSRGMEPVVVHHHFGATRYDYLTVGRFLREAGHPVLLVDGRSHGDSAAGAALGLDLERRPEDVVAAVDHLRTRGYRRFHGLGFSMGAAVVLMGASRCPGLISLVLDSGPAAHLYAACCGVIDGRLPDEPLARRRLAARRLYLDGRGWRYHRDLLTAARRIPDTPVLLLHGDRDPVIPPAQTERLRRRVLRSPCERIVLENTEHVTGWARHRRRYRTLVLDFLRGSEQEDDSATG
jgi:pimeloyl-ACP methyl ester carboxylesterase